MLHRSQSDEGKAYTQICWYQLLLGDTNSALESGKCAIFADPTSSVAQMNLAHALLLGGHFEEAKTKYLDNRSSSDGGQSFAERVRQDFDALRRLGRTHPDMERIDALLAPTTRP